MPATRVVTEFERLTGFRPSGKARFRVILDYGPSYGPCPWVEHCGAATLERVQERRRKLAQWPADKVRIVDLGANWRGKGGAR